MFPVLIQRRGDEVLFIRQQDHAALAAEIMSRWELGGLADHPRRAAILTATRHHDDGWQEEDEEMHVSGSGEPLDFVSVPPAVKQRIWPRAAGRLATASPYVAALVAQHAMTVHAPLRQDPAWQGFFVKMERTRDALLAQTTPEESAAAAEDYRFVRIGDQLSLIFCNGWTTPMSGSGYKAILESGSLEISPDPFGGLPLRMQVEARSLPDRSYVSNSDLRAAYASAPVVLLEGTAVGH
jgi:Protein of unknown function (DUF3891)